MLKQKTEAERGRIVRSLEKVTNPLLKERSERTGVRTVGWPREETAEIKFKMTYMDVTEVAKDAKQEEKEWMTRAR